MNAAQNAHHKTGVHGRRPLAWSDNVTHRVGIFLYDEVEVLDFAGPFEVFSTAARVKHNLHPDIQQPFEVITLASALEPVHGRGGLTIMPQAGLADHAPLDILIIPGGAFTPELERADLLNWVNRCAAKAKITASVCTGAFVLARAGLLEGKSATTHWEDIPALLAFPGIEVVSDRRWVDTGRIITSAGIAAGIDMCLHIVARLEGDELARLTARQMEYDWQPVDNS
jgi:transcriptional regulator GlxA family with amidase domain